MTLHTDTPTVTSGPPEPTPTSPSRSRHRIAGAALGLLSGAVALGVAQLTAGLVGGTSSPLIAVGGTVIDAVPRPVKEFAVRTFGTGDKAALLVGIGSVLAIVAALLGMASIRRPRVGVIGLLVLGGAGALAAVTRPGASVAALLPSIAGTLAGLVAFERLRLATGLTTPPPPSKNRMGGAVPPRPQAPPGTLDRRRFLWSGIGVAGVAAVSGFAGQYLVRRSQASASREAARIPTPASPAGPLPASVNVEVPGVASFVTPNDSFYKIDTTLLTPSVNADDWQLRLHGMVDRPIALNYRELLRRPLIERDITLACVSNEVGGNLISNARWIGAPLKPLLEEAGIRTGANQLVGRSVDGFTAGAPLALTMDGRDAMLAVAMNGEPLPLAHGFPVRMIVPGLYGYVSATKWVVDLEVTTFDAFDAYWIKRGWARQGPIKTESRIDTPRYGAKLTAGQEVPVAGVAWAQHRGISRVQVRVDNGSWVDAELGTEDTSDTWRQWVWRWTPTAGGHRIEVRATDGTGAVQTSVDAPPAPNGASGYHAVSVNAA
jgi:DMSO/TMAO reductase YedYZ molybdopterin-dependent catalytic subunit